jgi:hypothetical protein
MRTTQTRSKLIKKLDAVFSEYIRRRYAKDDIAECVTCGKQDHWKRLQAGHFMSRKHYATRWDEDNVQVQCSGCNVFRYGEQYKFSLYLGQEMADELYRRSNQTVKLSSYELQELHEFYQKKLADMK